MSTHHVVPASRYVLIFAILMVLTVTTVLVARVDLGVFSFIVAISIAIVKAMLVILFFMHVKDSSSMTKLFVSAGFVWMAVLLIFILTDYLTRPMQPHGNWW